MKDYQFDPTFDVKPVAFSIAHLITVSYEGDGWVRLMWSPFYNGRERGIALTIQNAKNERCTWVFGENRNSDNIILDTLEGGGKKDESLRFAGNWL